MSEEISANQNTTDIKVAEPALLQDTIKPEGDGNNFDPRKDIMAEIFKNRQKVLDAENQIATDQVAEHNLQSAPLAESPLTQENTEVVADPVAAEPAIIADIKAMPQEKYTIVVDGIPVEYTIDELKTQAQLGVGARKRFDEAAEMRRQAEQIMFAKNSQPQQVENQNTSSQVDIPEAELKDIAKRMNYGSEEEQVKALRDAGILFSKNQGRQGPTPEALVDIATRNALAVLDTRNEQTILANEFKDILSDPPIAHATDIIATQLAQKYQSLGQPKSRLEVLREAGIVAREKYLKPVQSESSNTVQQAGVSPMKEKLERKRTAPQPPSAASKIAVMPTQESGYKPSNIVAQMRKARGQQAF